MVAATGVAATGIWAGVAARVSTGFGAGGGTGIGLAADFEIACTGAGLVKTDDALGLEVPVTYDQVTGNRKVARNPGWDRT